MILQPHDIPDIEVRKWFLLKSEKGQTAYINPPPTILQLEVTKNCNLRCIMCHKGQCVDFDRTDMSNGILDGVRPIFPFLRKVMLFGDGEPMLYPRFWDLVKEIREASPLCYIDFINNGTAMTRRNVERCFEHKVSSMGLSLAGATAKTHNAIRLKSDLKQIITNFEYLRDRKKELYTHIPYVHASVVVMQSNLQELPDLVNLCAELGFYSLELQSLFVTHPSMEQEIVDESDLVPIRDACIKNAKSVYLLLTCGGKRLVNKQGHSSLDVAYGIHKFHRDDIGGYCKHQQPWNTVYVLANGIVVPDCHWWTSTRESYLNECGRLDETTNILDIWNGRNYSIIREKISKSIFLPQCRGCGLAGGIKESFRCKQTDHASPNQENQGKQSGYSTNSIVDVEELISKFDPKLLKAFLDGYEIYMRKKIVSPENALVKYFRVLREKPVLTEYDEMNENELLGHAEEKFKIITNMKKNGFDRNYPIRFFQKIYPRKSYSFMIKSSSGPIHYNAFDGYHRVMAAYHNNIKQVPAIQIDNSSKESPLALHPIDIDNILEKTKKEGWKWYQSINFGLGSDRIPFQNEDNNLHGVKKYEFIISRNVMPLKSRTVIDLGCNTGVITARMAEEHPDLIIGMDDTKHINQAIFVRNRLWKNYGNLVFQNMDMKNTILFREYLSSLPQIDLITMMNFIYYLGEYVEPLMQVISEFCPRVLLQGNTLKLNKDGVRSTRSHSDKNYRGEYATIEGMSSLLRKYNYKIRIDAPSGYLKSVVTGEK